MSAAADKANPRGRRQIRPVARPSAMGTTHRATTRRNAPRGNGGGYAVRWLGWGYRYSTQTPPPAAHAAKSHRWSDSPNPTSKQVERLILDGTNP